jgi:hypothetical protein
MEGEAIPRDTQVRKIGVPEHVAGDTELEHPDPVVDEYRHSTLPPGGRGVAGTLGREARR